MKFYKIISIYLILTNLLLNADNIDLNKNLDFINKKLLDLKTAERRFDIKRENFNKELYSQLTMIDNEKNKNLQILKNNEKLLLKINKQKENLLKLKKDIIKSMKNKLISIYNTMRARKSSKILSNLYKNNKKEALNIIMRINERKLKEILSNMKSNVASEITENINKKENIK